MRKERNGGRVKRLHFVEAIFPPFEIALKVSRRRERGEGSKLPMTGELMGLRFFALGVVYYQGLDFFCRSTGLRETYSKSVV